MKPSEHEPLGGLIAGFIVLIVAVVYVRALGGPFVWDDRHLILDADSLQRLDLSAVLARPFWDSSATYFRPLTTLSFYLDFALHGVNSSGFHLTNLLLHLSATALVFALLRRRGCTVALAGVASLLWALLPRLTEGAAWISGRTDVLASVLALIALCVYQPRSLWRLCWSALIALLALLSKEIGIGVFAALFALELLPRRTGAGAGAGAVPPLWQRALVLLTPLALYAALRASAGALSLGDGVRLGFFGRAMAVLEALGRYAFMLLDPLQPRSLLGLLGQPAWPFVGLGSGVAIAAIVAAIVGRRRLNALSGETLGYALLAALPLLLVLHLTALPVTVVAADRYLYLPSAALLLALAPSLQRLLAARPQLLGALLALCVACGIRTYQRVGDYADEALFWTAAVHGAPRHATSWIELGSVAYRAGMFDEALELYGRAVPLPGYETGRALDNTALVAAVSGRRPMAAQLGDALVTRFDRPEFRLRRATIALNALDLESARLHAERARQLMPSYAKASSFLTLLEALRAAQQRGTLADAQFVDVKALRYPELEARLFSLFPEPDVDPRLLQAGLEFLIDSADPRRVKPLLRAYAQRPGALDVERFIAALALRLETAENVQARLKELDFASAFTSPASEAAPRSAR